MSHKLQEIKPALSMLKISPTITSYIIGIEHDQNDDVIIKHRLNDEPRIRKARLRQNARGEHYFMCCGDRLYLADYKSSAPRVGSRIYRYH